MGILAQHGSMDGEKVAEGLRQGHLGGVILSPRDIKLDSMKRKLGELRALSPNATYLFDPQYYAALIAHEQGARLGNLLSDYSNYFKPTQIKDIRREKNIAEVIKQVHVFQVQQLRLDKYILPNIMIRDGLTSESANIGKLFLELGNEYANKNGTEANCFLTLALGDSCFKSAKDLEDLVDEITGLKLDIKGIYLLVECTAASGNSTWYEPFLLSGLMYLNFALSEAGYEVINGYSFDNAPYLAAAGGELFGSGWFNTSRYFSLDRYRARLGKGKRPNRKYLCRALWWRMDLATIRPLKDAFPWLRNKLPSDEILDATDPSELQECMQHWETLGAVVSDINSISDAKSKVQYLMDGLEQAQRLRSQLQGTALPKFEDQVRNLRRALITFQEVAEL